MSPDIGKTIMDLMGLPLPTSLSDVKKKAEKKFGRNPKSDRDWKDRKKIKISKEDRKIEKRSKGDRKIE